MLEQSLGAPSLSPSTKRNPAERILHENEERFRLLFNQMLVGCTLNEIICDQHGTPVDRVYLEVNPAFESLTGLRREEVIGKRMREVLPNVEPFWIESYGRVALTGEPARFEGYMRALDKYFDVSVFSPQPGQFTVTFIDITERKRVELALQISEKRYREFFERNGAGAFRNTLDGRILDCNDTFARMFGYSSKAEVLRYKTSDFFFNPHERDPHVQQLIKEKVFLNQEIRLRHKDGRPVWVLANVGLIEDEHQSPVVEGTLVDITARKAMESDLRSFLNISAVLNATLDIGPLMDSLIVEAIRFTGAESGCAGLRTPEGMVCHKYFRGSQPVPFEYCWPPGIGWPGWVLVHKVPYLTNDAPNDSVIVPEIRERFRVKSGIDTPLIDVRGEAIGFFEVNNKNGEPGFTRADLEKMTAVSEIASIALQNALAYRKLSETEESLRKLWNRLLEAQDEERRRIGRELHDVIGQVLTALAMRLGVARRMLGVDEGKVQQALSDGLALAKECSNTVRTLSYLLHPPVLEEGGLEAALRPYVEGFGQRSGIRVELDMPSEDERLPLEVENALFRVVQESLTNIHLHSGSSSATIRFVRKPSEVILEVSDGGQGIPHEILEKIRTRGVMPGVGIASMRERIQQVGGRLDISSDEHGTIVRTAVPLNME